MSFQGKVVIVTGSSSGIGAATALQLAELGAKVVVTGRNEARLKEVAKKFSDAGKKPLVIKADLDIDSDVKKVFEETVKEYGQIDVLINNAGAGTKAGIEDGIEPFDKMISTNLRSVYLLTSLAVPYLIKSKGVIVNVSSIAAVRPSALSIPYSIAKAGLDMFTKCIAKELAGHGIRVNSVNPGPVRTNFMQALGFSEEATETFLAQRLEKAPMGKFATSEDVADLIVFLAGDKSKSITGGIHLIDAGDLLSA